MKFLFIWLFIFNISFLFAQTDIETTLGIGAPKNVLRQNELRFQAGLIIKDKLPEDVSGFVGSYSTYKTHINSLGLTDLGVIEFDTNNNPVYISANNVTDIDAPNGTQFTGIKGMDDFVSKILVPSLIEGGSTLISPDYYSGGGNKHPLFFSNFKVFGELNKQHLNIQLEVLNGKSVMTLGAYKNVDAAKMSNDYAPLGVGLLPGSKIAAPGLVVSKNVVIFYDADDILNIKDLVRDASILKSQRLDTDGSYVTRNIINQSKTPFCNPFSNADVTGCLKSAESYSASDSSPTVYVRGGLKVQGFIYGDLSPKLIFSRLEENIKICFYSIVKDGETQKSACAEGGSAVCNLDLTISSLNYKQIYGLDDNDYNYHKDVPYYTIERDDNGDGCDIKSGIKTDYNINNDAEFRANNISDTNTLPNQAGEANGDHIIALRVKANGEVRTGISSANSPSSFDKLVFGNELSNFLFPKYDFRMNIGNPQFASLMKKDRGNNTTFTYPELPYPPENFNFNAVRDLNGEHNLVYPNGHVETLSLNSSELMRTVIDSWCKAWGFEKTKGRYWRNDCFYSHVSSFGFITKKFGGERGLDLYSQMGVKVSRYTESVVGEEDETIPSNVYDFHEMYYDEASSWSNVYGYDVLRSYGYLTLTGTDSNKKPITNFRDAVITPYMVRDNENLAVKMSDVSNFGFNSCAKLGNGLCSKEDCNALAWKCDEFTYLGSGGGTVKTDQYFFIEYFPGPYFRNDMMYVASLVGTSGTIASSNFPTINNYVTHQIAKPSFDEDPKAFSDMIKYGDSSAGKLGGTDGSGNVLSTTDVFYASLNKTFNFTADLLINNDSGIDSYRRDRAKLSVAAVENYGRSGETDRYVNNVPRLITNNYQVYLGTSSTSTLMSQIPQQYDSNQARYGFIPSNWDGRYQFNFDTSSYFFNSTEDAVLSTNVNVYALYPAQGYTGYGIKFAPSGPGFIENFKNIQHTALYLSAISGWDTTNSRFQKKSATHKFHNIFTHYATDRENFSSIIYLPADHNAMIRIDDWNYFLSPAYYPSAYTRMSGSENEQTITQFSNNFTIAKLDYPGTIINKDSISGTSLEDSDTRLGTERSQFNYFENNITTVNYEFENVLKFVSKNMDSKPGRVSSLSKLLENSIVLPLHANTKQRSSAVSTPFDPDIFVYRSDVTNSNEKNRIVLKTGQTSAVTVKADVAARDFPQTININEGYNHILCMKTLVVKTEASTSVPITGSGSFEALTNDNVKSLGSKNFPLTGIDGDFYLSAASCMDFYSGSRRQKASPIIGAIDRASFTNTFVFPPQAANQNYAFFAVFYPVADLSLDFMDRNFDKSNSMLEAYSGFPYVFEFSNLSLSILSLPINTDEYNDVGTGSNIPPRKLRPDSTSASPTIIRKY